jgi:[protein-PII] uridylyltransferase
MAASQFRIVVPRGDQLARREGRPGESPRPPSGDRSPTRRAGRTYRRRRRTHAAAPGPPSVVFDDAASSNATVIVVRAVTKIGILHRISKALGELGLDIRHATVQTIGMEVVDTFYVRADGGARHRCDVSQGDPSRPAPRTP